MTCETTGGLKFVHEHEVADMETENRLVVDCKDFESEADTGCVLAESCESCTRELEKEVNWLTRVVCWQRAATAVLVSQKKKMNWADMGCVLARGCDSCTHFFPPTPYGFRQVVQHISKHAAY